MQFCGHNPPATKTFVASCVITKFGVTNCTEYYDCVGADAAKIKSVCTTLGGGVGADTRCATAPTGGQCLLGPPCTQLQFMAAAGTPAANQKICETNLKGTFTAP